jgi:uncharacterized Zn finger protein (UPF0148 family)
MSSEHVDAIYLQGEVGCPKCGRRDEHTHEHDGRVIRVIPKR